MYARLTQIQIDPARLADMRAAMPGVGDRLKPVPGLIECKVCWDEQGQGLVFALYRSAAHAEAAADTVRGVWGGLAHMLQAPPQASAGTQVFDLLG